jgi:hypothetical protein
MRIFKVFLPAVLALIVAGAALAQSNLPRNSYLEKRVNSTSELIEHLRNNPVVMDRYRRHFAMTSDEVVDYLSSLRVSSLPKDGVFTVYGVPHSSGDFHAHLRTLKRGEPVFVEADGTPVLQLVCGNPLILGPKKPVTPNPVVATTGPVEGSKEVVVDSPPAPTTNPGTPEAPPVGERITPVYPPSRPSSSPVAALLGLAGAIGFFPHGHKPPPEVPEPVTMLVMVGGMAAMAARRRSKKTS